jgi:hypothetical protein
MTLNAMRRFPLLRPAVFDSIFHAEETAAAADPDADLAAVAFGDVGISVR